MDKPPFDFSLDIVGQLETVGAEDLDAVVLERIVGRADDHTGVGAHARRDEGDGRRRQRPHQHDVRAGRDDARFEGALEHVAGQSRVFADDDAAAFAALAKVLGDGAAERQGHLGGHGVLVRDTTDSVGAEESASRSKVSHRARHCSAFRGGGECLRWHRPP